MEYIMIDEKILDFDPVKEPLKVLVHQWIIRKIYLKSELSLGYFELTYQEIEKDLGISHGKAHRIIEEFIELEIIKPIKVTKIRGEKSIYAYTVIIENKQQNGQQNGQQNSSNFNMSSGVAGQQNEPQNGTENEAYNKIKKEYYGTNKPMDIPQDISLEEAIRIVEQMKEQKVSKQKAFKEIKKVTPVEDKPEEPTEMDLDESITGTFKPNF